MNLGSSIFRKRLCLPFLVAIASLTLLASTDNGYSDNGSSGSSSSENSDSSWFQSLVDAWQAWLESFSGGNGSSGDSQASSDSGTEEPETSGGTTTPADTTSGTTASPNAVSIAAVIANDAGGHADQYTNYSERLAATLGKLTAAQRARVLTD